ncbi:MAG: hypothetical protein E7256_07565 [Lachnospiraceae bacterium]|nr:hypothetical protein [Lachnospiraceae bacterium]
MIVDTETGEVLDDAQGYGYRDARKAHTAFWYKNRDKSQDAERNRKDSEIEGWCRENRQFLNLLEEVSFEIAKGSWGPDDKVDAKLVKKLLSDSGLTIPFSPGELLRYWRKH